MKKVVLLKGKGLGSKVVSAKACVIKVLQEAQKYFKAGDIIVTPKITDDLLPFIKHSTGVIVGTWESDESQQAKVVSDLLDIPVIVCNENVVELIPDGVSITIDSIKGVVYVGNKF